MKSFLVLFTFLATVWGAYEPAPRSLLGHTCSEKQLNHPAVLHCPVEVAEHVMLEDGSTWAIREADIRYVNQWQPTDQVVIAQNSSFFSQFDYVLINQNSFESVQANLAPSSNLTTHQIASFNDQLDYVELDDGSTWSVSYFDHSSMMRWCENDLIIIGVNQGWDQYLRPNILINATVKQYMRAKRVN